MTGLFWLMSLMLALTIVGVATNYRRPQDDPVWKMLVRDGVIEDEERGQLTDDAFRYRVCRCGHAMSYHLPMVSSDCIECDVCDGDERCGL